MIIKIQCTAIFIITLYNQINILPSFPLLLSQEGEEVKFCGIYRRAAVEEDDKGDSPDL